MAALVPAIPETGVPELPGPFEKGYWRKVAVCMLSRNCLSISLGRLVIP